MSPALAAVGALSLAAVTIIGLTMLRAHLPVETRYIGLAVTVMGALGLSLIGTDQLAYALAPYPTPY